ncbi:retrovirus-related pol polyprotein from transposon TNT 1-94 [Tanacetum coccineum]|uniref:Retrovirus-related pol polyprotein from transposon TNT 1-94 n=1 Tax=Tanacetum coccineum TaxID=301880 RepID=A0ABQ5HJ22_9ASTR
MEISTITIWQDTYWQQIDGILIASNNKELIQNIKQHVNAKFNIKDIGPLHYYLGIEFFRNATGLAMSQRKYAMDLVKHVGLLDTKPSMIPLDPTVKFTMDKGEPIHDSCSYKTLVGKLLYLTITGLDLAFLAQAL